MSRHRKFRRQRKSVDVGDAGAGGVRPTPLGVQRGYHGPAVLRPDVRTLALALAGMARAPTGWAGMSHTGLCRGPNAGKVKFDTKMKDAQVYVDGGYGQVRWRSWGNVPVAGWNA